MIEHELKGMQVMPEKEVARTMQHKDIKSVEGSRILLEQETEGDESEKRLQMNRGSREPGRAAGPSRARRPRNQAG